MKWNLVFKFNVAAFIVFFLPVAMSWAITKEMHSLVRMETRSNAVASRSSEFIRLENYEIPLDLLELNIASRANPSFVNSMIFERNGKKFLRWVINPEDTKWHREVEDFLKMNGIEARRHHHFIGYMTASRSYIVVDPNTGAEFSLKVSTDKTGGNWRDKKQTLTDAQQIRMISDFVSDQLQTQPKLQNIILADEPMIFGIKNIDQGMVIRSYEGLSRSGRRYVPGFAIMHEKLGRELALANGSKDPAGFWNEHYNKPLARALAEFFVLTGMTYDSPHSQNFLVELDEKNRPTGRIILRDFGDTYLLADFFNSVNRADIVEQWEQKNILTEEMKVSVSILEGSIPPSWIKTKPKLRKANSYDSWGDDFFKEFENEFRRQTGLSLSDNNESPVRRGFYFSKYYSFNTDSGKRFLELSKNRSQRKNLLNYTCEKVF